MNALSGKLTVAIVFLVVPMDYNNQNVAWYLTFKHILVSRRIEQWYFGKMDYQFEENKDNIDSSKAKEGKK